VPPELRVLLLFTLTACGDRAGFVLSRDATPSGCEAFCEQFVQTSAQLDPARWSVSRLSGADDRNQGFINGWSPSTLASCDGSHPAKPDDGDVVVCNGQLRESSNDNGGPTVLAMSLNQPFDFANRLGSISFDVTNDTSGNHGAWPALWLTEDPVPAPDAVNVPCTLCSVPRNGIGINFSGNLAPGSGAQVAGCPNDEHPRWIVASMIVVRDYVVEVKGYGPGAGEIQIEGCAISASGPDGAPNHIEVRLSKDQVEVWATDPGSSELKPLAQLPDAGLTFTRGYLALEDKHFDAAQSPEPATATHTFAWSNIAFDGPKLPAVHSHPVPDALTLQSNGAYSLGWATDPASPVSLTTPSISAVDLASATGALLVFNVGHGPIASFSLSVDGTAATASTPFAPDGTLWRSVALPVPLASLKAGVQNLTLAGDQPTEVANVSLLLVDF